MASSPEINQFNEGWRSSPIYQQILQQVGVNPSGPIQLSDQQRKQVQLLLEQNGVMLPKGSEIDPAGNANEPNNKLRNTLIGAGIAGAAATGLGAAGIGPMAGAFGGASGAAGAVAPSVVGGGVPSGLGFGGLSAGQAYGAAAPAAGGGIGGFFGKAANFLKGNAGQIAGAVGSALGAGASAAAHNRGVTLDADIARAQLDQQAGRDFFDQTLAREDEGRKKQRNAWEMSNRAAYVKNAPDNLNRTSLSPYSKPLAGPSGDQRTAATGMFDQMSQQLAEGNTVEKPQRVGTDVRVQQPGFFEKWGGMLAPGMTAGSELWRKY